MEQFAPLHHMGKTKSKRQPKSRKSPMGTAVSRAKYFKSKEYKDKMKKMAPAHKASLGNDFWRRRTKHGRDAIFSSPEIMAEAMMDYFVDNKEHPWIKQEWKTTNGKLKLVGIPTETPLSWEGLAIHLHVSTGFFRTFKVTLKKDDPKRHGFLAVMEWADNIIRKQKFEGAAVGAYNAALISYDLGIRKDMPQGTGGAGVVINVQENKSKDLLNEVVNRLNDLDKDDK